jgi:hypothetical protein
MIKPVNDHHPFFLNIFSVHIPSGRVSPLKVMWHHEHYLDATSGYLVKNAL